MSIHDPMAMTRWWAAVDALLVSSGHQESQGAEILNAWYYHPRSVSAAVRYILRIREEDAEDAARN